LDALLMILLNQARLLKMHACCAIALAPVGTFLNKMHLTKLILAILHNIQIIFAWADDLKN
jgi:hypothetical protein